MELKGKTALITGSGGIIGSSIALRLAQEGVNLLLHFRSRSKYLDELENSLKHNNYKYNLLESDIFDSRDCEDLLDRAYGFYPQVDFMVNTIGDFLQKPLPELKAEEFERIIHSNLNIAFHLTQAAFPKMQKNNFGKIIHFGLSSASQITAKPSILPYHIAKAGLILLAKSYSKEGFQNNVSVNCISLGVCVGTPFTPSSEYNLVKISEVVDLVGFVLKADGIKGANLEINGGWGLD